MTSHDETQAIRAERDAAVRRALLVEDRLARVSTVVRDVLRTPAAGLSRLEVLTLLVRLEARLAIILDFPPDELCGEGQLGLRWDGVQGERREPPARAAVMCHRECWRLQGDGERMSLTW